LRSRVSGESGKGRATGGGTILDLGRACGFGWFAWFVWFDLGERGVSIIRPLSSQFSRPPETVIITSDQNLKKF
jgi:hypothetical protein